jgi:hypothetical protein
VSKQERGVSAVSITMTDTCPGNLVVGGYNGAGGIPSASA